MELKLQLRIMTADPRIEPVARELGKELADVILVFNDSDKTGSFPTLSLVAFPMAEGEGAPKNGFRLKQTGASAELHYSSLTGFARGMLMAASGAFAAFLGDPSAPRTLEEELPFEELGVMIDCSRNAVPTVETVKKQIRLCALMGMNLVGLYMEDTFEVPGEPYFGYLRGRYSCDELKEMDRYAASLGVELRPYIQTLAHLNQIFRYETYRDAHDTDDILLIGSERTDKLLENIIGTLAECFTTRIFNLGMDEAHMLGLGQYLDRNGYEARTDLMVKHLNHVMEICRRHGIRAQVWADMFYTKAYVSKGDNYKDTAHPDIPGDVELIYWDYYHRDKALYNERFRDMKELLGVPISFAGGATKWVGFTPLARFSVECGEAAIPACIENDVRSCVVTAWGDNGAECSLFAILPVFFADAGLAYEGENFDKRPFRLLTGLDYDEFLAVDRLGEFTRQPKMGNSEKYLLYNDPMLGSYDSLLIPGLEEHYRRVSGELDALLEKNSEYGYLFRTMQRLANVLAVKADLGLRLRKAYQRGDRAALKAIWEELPKLREELSFFERTFRRQWLKENKAYGYEVQSVRLGGLMQRLAYTQDVLGSYLEKETDRIEELEAEILDFGMQPGAELEVLCYNSWERTASASPF